MVIDTHVFLWYINNAHDLPSHIKDLMASQPENIYVPSICFWELMFLHEKGRLRFNRVDPKIYLRENLLRTGFQEITLTLEMAMLSRTLPFAHGDPADRFIAATANAMNMPLITYDQKLIDLPWLKTIS